jgi:predicted site-specific integrase-resolvase
MDEEVKRYIRIGKAAKILGVAPSTLRHWAEEQQITSFRTPAGHLRFDVSGLVGNQCSITRSVILYSRVSSSKQRDDLKRQQQYLRERNPHQCDQLIEVSDIGSGLNFKRPGLLRILGSVLAGNVSYLVVASRDRLARFGHELIFWLCERSKTQVVVLDNNDATPEDELGSDLMAIVQVYCCRWNGQRRYQKKRAEKNSETSTPTQPVAT